MDLQAVKVSELKFYPGNPRRIDKETLERLKWSIQEFGVVEPLVINGKKQVIGGNQRLKALRELGIEEVDCIQVDLPVEKEKALNLALNKITGEWDIELLKTFILDIEDNLLELVGFDTKEIDELTDIETEIEGEDEVPELEEETFTQTGDIWILGRHRLMCGDATRREDLEKLMNGGKADMVYTDPPYNVAYGKNKRHPSWNVRQLKGDNQKPEEWEGFNKRWITNVIEFYKGGDFYCWGAPGPEGMRQRLWLVELGFHWSATIIWKKDRLVLSPAKYQRMYEPCFYGWYEKSSYVGGRKETEVWEAEKPVKSEEHPTMKPVKLCKRAIKNSSKREDIVLDLFGGAGSTLIACEETKRICYMMEIDPHYCDVIVKRYLKFTGKEDVVLIRGGKEIPYSEIKGQIWT